MSTMSNRHFVAIAKTVAKRRSYMPAKVYDDMITEFIVFFRTVNPAFDAVTFRVACNKEYKDDTNG